MSLTAFLTTVASLFRRTDTDDGGLGGASAVEIALAEKNGLADQSFTATLGEPDLDTIGGAFINNPRVTIPVYDVPVGDGGTMALELEEFELLLDYLDLDSTRVTDVAGTDVPIEYIEGSVVVDWQRVLTCGSDETQWTDDEIEEFMDDDTDDEQPTDDDGGVEVQMEEVNVSPSSESSSDEDELEADD